QRLPLADLEGNAVYRPHSRSRAVKQPRGVIVFDQVGDGQDRRDHYSRLSTLDSHPTSSASSAATGLPRSAAPWCTPASPRGIGDENGIPAARPWPKAPFP